MQFLKFVLHREVESFIIKRDHFSKAKKEVIKLIETVMLNTGNTSFSIEGSTSVVKSVYFVTNLFRSNYKKSKWISY